MSTKNLARTVIEGGRSGWSRFARRHSHALVRAREREVSHALGKGADFDALVYPKRDPVYRDFADKLGPARRWLRAQANRPWNQVRSELFARFDTRTTAGRHILFGHLLPEVEAIERYSGLTPRRRCFIDAHGYLRVASVRRKRARTR